MNAHSSYNRSRVKKIPLCVCVSRRQRVRVAHVERFVAGTITFTERNRIAALNGFVSGKVDFDNASIGIGVQRAHRIVNFELNEYGLDDTHVLVHRVRQLPVVVQDEPSSLPSLENKLIGKK